MIPFVKDLKIWNLESKLISVATALVSWTPLRTMLRSGFVQFAFPRHESDKSMWSDCDLQLYAFLIAMLCTPPVHWSPISDYWCSLYWNFCSGLLLKMKKNKLLLHYPVRSLLNLKIIHSGSR